MIWLIDCECARRHAVNGPPVVKLVLAEISFEFDIESEAEVGIRI